MILQRRKVFSLFFIVLIQLNCETKSALLQSIELKEYPSGSAIEYFDNKVYLVGDDARDMLILNTAFEVEDSINLIKTHARRIPKNEKPDFESITSTLISGIPHLLVFGSGSLDTTRNKALLINVKTKQASEYRLDDIYSRIRMAGIKELNVEGLCKTRNGYILGNRGNKGNPENHLIISSDFLNTEDKTNLKIIKIESALDHKFFSGVSGLDYSEKKDLLIMSISSENTSNAYDDGEIGKSYLWIIKNVSAKENNKLVKPDAIIDLEELDKAFIGHKVESVSIISESNHEYELVLVADDDKGSSLLFRIRLTASDLD